MNLKPKYHPVIENNMVTSGINIGRMKDTLLLQDAADKMNRTRNQFEGNDFDTVRAMESRFLQGKLAEAAVQSAVEEPLKKIAAHGLDNTLEDGFQMLEGQPLPELPTSSTLAKEAEQVSNEYTTLDDVAYHVAKGE